MKKKIISILLATLSTLMLFGCGAKGTATTENGETANVEISEKKVAKADTVSEFFSKGKHYACLVRGMSKDVTPIEIYFFEDGNVTILPGDVYGCTLGELAQMSDDDIWTKYQDARESYKTIYLENKEQDSLQKKSDIQQDIDILSRLNGKSIAELEDSGESDLIEFVANGSYGLDVILNEGKYDEPIVTTDIINSLSVLLNNDMQYKGPFYDQPIKFVIETDSTGNATQTETICYPTDQDYIDENGTWEVPTGTCEGLVTFDVSRGGIGGEIQIYDTNYFYYDVVNGDYFCTPGTIQLDDPKSKNCIVDPSNDEKAEMFRDIINAR